ncbi:MAG: S8 family serine peptidase [Clostridia bacterium]|nr:S8 family serine peptidase [Clostridia bacterium]
MKHNFFHKSVSLILAALMLPVSPVSADDGISVTPSDRVPSRGVFGEVIPASRTDDTDASSGDVRVSVILEDDCAIDAGFADSNSRDAVTYRQALLTKQDEIAGDISRCALDGDELDVVWNLTLAANLISANVPESALEDILAVDGVADVIVETVYYPCVVDREEVNDPAMATSSAMTGTTAAWAEGYTGAGQRVAVIDTGTDTDHISFDEGAFLHALSESDTGWDLLDADEIASVWDQLNLSQKYKGTPESLYINAKLPFGYNYIDRNNNVTHDRDSQGSHGSHVAGIAAANRYIPTGDGYADAHDAVAMAGAAPDCQLLTMKVFGRNGGAYDSDYMAAIEDAIVLGCDAVNLSLGTAGAGSSRSSVTVFQEILDNLSKTSTVVTVSGGNSYSWAYAASPLSNSGGWGYPYADRGNFSTATAPGTFTNNLSVASAENDGSVDPYLICGGMRIFYTETSIYGNASFASEPGEYTFVFLPDAGNEDADCAALTDVLAGNIAVIRRGETTFAEKANAAVMHGAAGVIIVNSEDAVLNMDLMAYYFNSPVASVTLSGGEILLESAEAVTDENGNVLYYTGKVTVSDGKGAHVYGSENYTMSDFSSWGIPSSLELKPEITTPGGRIYSVDGSVKSGDAYKVMSGTSMAAPQAAGMTAVLAQYIEENDLTAKTGLTSRTLAQSLLLSTAQVLTDPASDYGTPYSVMKQGAGLANVGAAVSADSYLIMDDGTNAGASDGKIKAELGDDPERTGIYTYGFTLYNLTDEDTTYAFAGEYFTQDFFADSANDAGDTAIFMDETTYPLLMHTTYTADGAEITSEPGIFARDFNGDGDIDENDGQALLDYAVGVRDSIHDADNADLNADGRVDSYDAYLFFTSYSDAAVTVPAGGGVHITVTASLSEDYADFLTGYMENGFYIEGYTTVRALTTDDGEVGETHAIPVIGYFGSWTDMPMFDVGTAVEYLSGDETRTPYLYGARKSAAYYANALTLTYADEPGESYVWGGNPLVPDKTYLAERNSYNNQNGDTFDKFRFAAIRPASAARITVTSGDELLAEQKLGTILPAYWHVTRKTWMSTSQSVTVDAMGALASLREGDEFALTLTLAPEYYVSADGAVRWDDLSDGASLSFPGVIDTTPPTSTEPVLDPDAMTLTVTAWDNRYVAAVVLYNTTGTEALTYTGAEDDIEPGEAAEYTLDLSGVSGTKFLLTVYDYAMNGTSFEVSTELGQADPAESVTVTPETLTLMTGTMYALSASVLPESADPGVAWSSSDASVASVDKFGNVTAVSDGIAEITASAPGTGVYDTCTVTVETIDVTVRGILQGEDTVPRFFDWNTASGEITSSGEIDGQITSAADSGMDGISYVVTDSFIIKAIDTAGAELASYDTNNYPIWDFTASRSYTDDNGTPRIHGIYWTYLTPSSPIDAYELDTKKTSVNLASTLRNGTGAKYLTGIAAQGKVTVGGITGEGVYLLDSTGAVWLALIDDAGKVTMLGSFPSNLTACGAEFAGYGTDYLFCSLVIDTDGTLWLSEYRGDTSILYRMTYVSETKHFDAVRIGDMGENNWPAALLHVNANADAAPDSVFDDLDPAEFTAIPADSTYNPAVSGTLQAISDALTKPANTAEPIPGVTFDGDTITLTVTAKDESGSETASVSGITEVRWDPASLAPLNTAVFGDYTAEVHDDGAFTFGYVSLSGTEAGIPVAVLTFKALTPDPGDIAILRREVNSTALNTAETVDLHIEHVRTERVGYKLATLTKDGYTGDIVCTDCGVTVREGVVIPAAGGPAIDTESGVPMAGVTIPGTDTAVTGWAKIMREIYAARKLRDERMAAEKRKYQPCDDCACVICGCDSDCGGGCGEKDKKE